MQNLLDESAAGVKTGWQRQQTDGLMMDDGVQKSCWGVTVKAMIGFGALLLLAWLIGGTDTAAVVAVAK